MKLIKNIFLDYKFLLRNIPGLVTSFFFISIITMNLMANKIIFNSEYISLDGGFLLSWIPFLCLDVVSKRFGYKAANKLTILGLFINLLFVAIFAIVSALQIEIGEAYRQGDVFESFNSVFRCTWFVLLGSSLAFLVSGITNNGLNHLIGLSFKKNPDGKLAFITRSYVSTFIGQYIDNLLFATIVFIGFAPIYWGYQLTIYQCLGSALFGSILELVMEIIFSPLGYKIVTKWQKEEVGKDYLERNK